jgi:hypothetical protein
VVASGSLTPNRSTSGTVQPYPGRFIRKMTVLPVAWRQTATPSQTLRASHRPIPPLPGSGARMVRLAARLGCPSMRTLGTEVAGGGWGRSLFYGSLSEALAAGGVADVSAVRLRGLPVAGSPSLGGPCCLSLDAVKGDKKREAQVAACRGFLADLLMRSVVPSLTPDAEIPLPGR